MRHPSFHGPVNIGSEEMVSIDQLTGMIMNIAGKRLDLVHVPGPEGVRGRTSDNNLVLRMMDWRASAPLEAGLSTLYRWVDQQVQRSRGQSVPLAA
jgi:nucleoside-diphosphate-sugar epimerase